LAEVHVFWVVTPCRVTVGYQRHGVSCCLHLHPKDGGGVFTAVRTPNIT